MFSVLLYPPHVQFSRNLYPFSLFLFYVFFNFEWFFYTEDHNENKLLKSIFLLFLLYSFLNICILVF